MHKHYQPRARDCLTQNLIYHKFLHTYLLVITMMQPQLFLSLRDSIRKQIFIMLETESTCNINLYLVPKRESETETDRNHVALRHTCATESEEVTFPFNRSTDSFRLLSVYRYAERIKHFLGWKGSFRGDSDAKENFSLENLSVNGKHCSNDSLKKELDLSEERKKNNYKEDKVNIVSKKLSEKEFFFK